jgi:hypothetical protein
VKGKGTEKLLDQDKSEAKRNGNKQNKAKKSNRSEIQANFFKGNFSVFF